MAEKTNFGGFAPYNKMLMEITGDLKKLKEYSEKLELKGNTESIDEIIKRITEDNFNIAIIGEFNRGKSTLINALLGKDVLPMDVMACTATLNKISYNITPYVRIEYKNGKKEEIEIEKLKSYVTKTTKEGEQVAKTIKEATVFYPVNYCKNRVTIIDTPGLNDDEAMTEVVMSVLPTIDAALMVIMAQIPFSASERDFLENKVITSDLGRVLFVVTGIDLLDEEDVDRVLNNIAENIQQHIMTKAANTYGASSKEYETYKRKLGKVRVYGVSAKLALKAKLKGDNEMLEKSCFPTFEAALERFLTEDRGAVTLSVPVSRIKTSSIELIKAVQLRVSALSMKKEIFESNYEKAMKEIENIRIQRRLEFENINKSSKKAFDDLTPLIDTFWPSLTTAAEEAIDSYSLTAEDIKKENVQATQEAMTKAVKNAVSKAGQNITERIQEGISIALENEAERLAGFEDSFYQATEKIQNMFTVDLIKTPDDTTALVGETAMNFMVSGLGGVLAGYKAAGWKGALLGGATGFAGTAGVLALISALAIPLTWPAFIIAGIGAAITGTFACKFALGKAFPPDEKFKNAFKEAVIEEISKMKADDDFTEKVRGQVKSAFEALKTKLTTETENILNDTQNNLTKIKVELAQNDVMSQKEGEELMLMLESINTICARADGISKQLAAVLDR